MSPLIFDGYNKISSIKSHEHIRRTKFKGSLQNLVVRENYQMPYSQELYLSNSHNKAQLILLLSDLKRDGQEVHICKEGAGPKIVAKSLEVAKEISPCIFVADDTDIAVMLLYHYKNELKEIFFIKNARKNSGV